MYYQRFAVVVVFPALPLSALSHPYGTYGRFPLKRPYIKSNPHQLMNIKQRENFTAQFCSIFDKISGGLEAGRGAR